MRQTAQKGSLQLRAIAGTRVALLAINIDKAGREGLLGFAIGKKVGGEINWLEGRKVFGTQNPNPKAADSYPTNLYPVQSFIWSDFEAHPGTEYTSLWLPCTGSPVTPD